LHVILIQADDFLCTKRYYSARFSCNGIGNMAMVNEVISEMNDL